MNERVEVKIGTRRLVVEMEGFIPLEIARLAEMVSERMTEVQQQHDKVADTSKIALLVALSFAADLNKERAAHKITRDLLENSVERLSRTVRDSLDACAPPSVP